MILLLCLGSAKKEFNKTQPINLELSEYQVIRHVPAKAQVFYTEYFTLDNSKLPVCRKSGKLFQDYQTYNISFTLYKDQWIQKTLILKSDRTKILLITNLYQLYMIDALNEKVDLAWVVSIANIFQKGHDPSISFRNDQKKMGLESIVDSQNEFIILLSKPMAYAFHANPHKQYRLEFKSDVQLKDKNFISTSYKDRVIVAYENGLVEVIAFNNSSLQVIVSFQDQKLSLVNDMDINQFNNQTYVFFLNKKSIRVYTLDSASFRFTFQTSIKQYNYTQIKAEGSLVVLLGSLQQIRDFSIQFRVNYTDRSMKAQWFQLDRESLNDMQIYQDFVLFVGDGAIQLKQESWTKSQDIFLQSKSFEVGEEVLFSDIIQIQRNKSYSALKVLVIAESNLQIHKLQLYPSFLECSITESAVLVVRDYSTICDDQDPKLFRLKDIQAKNCIFQTQYNLKVKYHLRQSSFNLFIGVSVIVLVLGCAGNLVYNCSRRRSMLQVQRELGFSELEISTINQ